MRPLSIRFDAETKPTENINIAVKKKLINPFLEYFFEIS